MEIERQLSDVLSEFARTLATDFPIQSILDHLVGRIVDVLPISAAGVTLISPGVLPRFVAASDDSALRYEQLQSELGEGPCLAAYNAGEAVVVPDLRLDDRFPTFAPRAVREGLLAVFTFPLRHGDAQLGALDLYRSTAGPLDVAAMVAAQTLADVAAAYLLNAQARVDLRESSDRAHEIALHDALTGLPNRTLLIQRLQHAIQRCRRSGKMVAILFADLDMFKAVNDTYGHRVGDQLLVAVAERLAAVLRPGDTLARLGGDEFVILCEDLDLVAQVEPLAARIGAALREPFVLGAVDVQISASVGIAFAGRGIDVPEQVLQEADTAMYQVKRTGGARHGILDLGIQGHTNDQARLDRDLRGALARQELQIAYQPIVDIASGQIAGVEALLRWAHPSRGVIGPAVVIPLAEQAGLISDIGCWVLEQSCLDRRRWQHPHLERLELSINVSARQLMTSGFAAAVAAILKRTDTDPELVTLEMTESVLLKDPARALLVLKDLKDLGVMLALDDFGTGYSSLGYLKSLPFDTLKIDRVFIADLENDAASRVIVRGVVGIAHGLGMAIVAEGVETGQQHDQVVDLDCEFYQGFYFARPMPADSIADALKRSYVTPLRSRPTAANR